VKSKLSVEQLFADLISQSNKHSGILPPIHLWHPEKTGDMDLRIDREGRWFHESVQIKRPAMVKLFSSLLKLEAGDYYLVSPQEKWRIEVDIAPFYIIDTQRVTREGIQVISFKTSTDECILLGRDNQLIIDTSRSDEPIMPLVNVRDNLMGLLSRSVYYQLIDWAQAKPQLDDRSQLIIDSLGCQFPLGDFPE